MPKHEHHSQELSPDLVRALESYEKGMPPHTRRLFMAFSPLLFARLGAVRGEALPNEVHAAIAAGTFTRLAGWQRGTAHVGVLPLSGDAAADGRAASAATGPVLTALVVINDDKPFLVSSVMGEIQARGLKTRLVLHPVFAAQRTAETGLADIGALRQISDAETAQGWGAESVIIIVVEAMDSDAQRETVAALADVLDEVGVVVRDWPQMLLRLDAEIVALEERAHSGSASLVGETISFCRWMRAGQFVFLGMREYRLDGDPETGSLRVVEGSGKGLLANPNVHVLRRGRELVSLTDEIRRFYLKPSPIIITKSNVTSRVHRRAHMDYIGLKTYTPEGRLAGELRIVGLFTAAAYTEPTSEIPFLRLKVDRVFKAAKIEHASHEGRMLQNTLDTFPRDELFQIGIEQLASWVPTLLQLEFDPRVRAFARRDRFDRFVSILVFAPRDRFSSTVREAIGEMLANAYQGRVVVQQPFFTAGPLVRVHYIIGRYEGATPDVEEEELERRIGEIVETWEDRLHDRLAGTPDAAAQFAGAFSAAYAETFPPERALEDIERIERLGRDGAVAIDFYQSAQSHSREVRAAIYRFDDPIPLSDRVPILENLGFSVIDERTYRIAPRWNGERRSVCLHDMVLSARGEREFDLSGDGVTLEQAFVATFTDQADNDQFNELVMVADADWREAAMLRAYAGYMRQIGLPYGRTVVAGTLIRYRERARDLISLFRSRLDPAFKGGFEERDRRETELKAAFEAHLAEVPSLEDDRILRVMLGLISATQRTNFFVGGEDGAHPAVLAFKIASREVADAPEPKPFREIWVSGPQVDGVHLRFAPIARGGLRWSDRPQDFRTEVLGLAKAQQVKNTVIVPQGAKGGFVPKLLPVGGTREAVMEAGIAAYRTFISSLLDLTDNIVDGKIVPPAGIVRRDGDDPYLVVAADKGTATFSDFANQLSKSRNYWLGDAFASGGSAGYDHKKMGITARGAWEGVKRHFREMDHDIQSEPFTVAGVGDMSGDVFGNGMLLSRHICLVAAFDHRDIFIDPDPDMEKSYAERERIFSLPRSSWQDYDRALISEGGGVFSRSAKSIALTPQIKALLLIGKDHATPAEVMRAILEAKVDLFWFGGIGTYVRGDSETDADIGDRANDPIRVPTRLFGARVVGEGANLGMSQRARIDFSLRGGRINTDFIDNSAGVNSSDQEVNIKIALAPALASGRLDEDARNALLTRMTDDVAHACLANNYAQTLAISIAERRGAAGMSDAVHLIQQLERRGLLDRALESLADDVALEERRKGGAGLTRPELAILMSHAKIALSYDLIASHVPDDAAVAGELPAYFPHELRETHGDDIAAHPLKREIITTALTNAIVNIAGMDLPARLADDWDLGPAEVSDAIITALEVLDARRQFAAIGAEDNRIPGALQLSLYAKMQQLVRNRAAWQAAEMRSMPALTDAIRRQQRAYATLAATAAQWSTEQRQAARSAEEARWREAGVPQTIAEALATAQFLSESGDICLVAEGRTGAAASSNESALIDAAASYVAIGDALRLTALKQQGRDIVATDRFDRLAINSAITSLAGSHRAMTLRLLNTSPSGVRGAEAMAAWRRSIEGPFGRAERRLAEMMDSGPLSVARLTVAAAIVRELTDTA
ncbi:MAG: NAD-glutamate dehydrogenase [Hyphomicrobiaceae bacterium]|nr:NAD-glutamate dehydrogenase [Hyphomicrobiaceae bacterium]